MTWWVDHGAVEQAKETDREVQQMTLADYVLGQVMREDEGRHTARTHPRGVVPAARRKGWSGVIAGVVLLAMIGLVVSAF